MTTVLLAHGSPDGRHSAALERLRSRVAPRLSAAGHGPTLLSYLESDAPGPAELGTRLTGRVTVLPMLLTPAMHARVDVPAAVSRLGAGGAEVRLAAPLGGHPLLLDAVAERLRSVDRDPAGPVLLVAGGSSSGQAGQSLRSLLDRYPRPGWMTMTLSAPRAGATTGRAVVPATLAEGVLHDKAQELAKGACAPFVPGGLADTEAMTRLVAHRAGA